MEQNIKHTEESLQSLKTYDEWLDLNRQIFLLKLQKDSPNLVLKPQINENEDDTSGFDPTDFIVVIRHILIPLIWSQYNSNKGENYAFFMIWECNNQAYCTEVVGVTSGCSGIHFRYAEIKTSAKSPQITYSLYFARLNIQKTSNFDVALKNRKVDRQFTFHKYITGSINIKELQEYTTPAATFTLKPVKFSETNENLKSSEQKNIEKMFKDVETLFKQPKHGVCCAFIVCKLTRSETHYSGLFLFQAIKMFKGVIFSKESLLFSTEENVLFSKDNLAFRFDKVNITGSNKPFEIMLDDSESGGRMNCCFTDVESKEKFLESLKYAKVLHESWKGKLLMQTDTIDYDKMLQTCVNDKESRLDRLEECISFFDVKV